MPSIYCFRYKNHLFIHFFHEFLDEFKKYFYYGLIQRSAELMWNLNTLMDIVDCSANSLMSNSNLKKYLACYKLIEPMCIEPTKSLLYMDGNNFKNIFPYTIVFDRRLDIEEIGDGLAKFINPEKSGKLNLIKNFNIVEPKNAEYTFEFFINNKNIIYKIQPKEKLNEKNKSLLIISGSLTYLESDDYLLFIGSPSVSSLECLIDVGMYVSDIPLYDATRDLILLNEQTKAQVNDHLYLYYKSKETYNVYF